VRPIWILKARKSYPKIIFYYISIVCLLRINAIISRWNSAFHVLAINDPMGPPCEVWGGEEEEEGRSGSLSCAPNDNSLSLNTHKQTLKIHLTTGHHPAPLWRFRVTSDTVYKCSGLLTRSRNRELIVLKMGRYIEIITIPILSISYRRFNIGFFRDITAYQWVDKWTIGHSSIILRRTTCISFVRLVCANVISTDLGLIIWISKISIYELCLLRNFCAVFLS